MLPGKFPLYSITSLWCGTKLYCLVTEPHGCVQLVQNCCAVHGAPTGSRTRALSIVKSNVRPFCGATTPSRHVKYDNYKTFNKNDFGAILLLIALAPSLEEEGKKEGKKEEEKEKKKKKKSFNSESRTNSHARTVSKPNSNSRINN